MLAPRACLRPRRACAAARRRLARRRSLRPAHSHMDPEELEVQRAIALSLQPEEQVRQPPQERAAKAAAPAGEAARKPPAGRKRKASKLAVFEPSEAEVDAAFAVLAQPGGGITARSLMQASAGRGMRFCCSHRLAPAATPTRFTRLQASSTLGQEISPKLADTMLQVAADRVKSGTRGASLSAAAFAQLAERLRVTA